MDRGVRLLATAVALLAVAAAGASAQPAGTPLRVFTAEQAERGQALYEEICIECHLSSLAGGASEAR